MVKTRYFLITNRFEGEPKETDFKLIEEELPDLKDGGKTFVFQKPYSHTR